jgi:hypothetical protein
VGWNENHVLPNNRHEEKNMAKTKTHTPYTPSALQKAFEAYGSAVAIGQFLEARCGKPFPDTRPMPFSAAEEYLLPANHSSKHREVR